MTLTMHKLLMVELIMIPIRIIRSNNFIRTVLGIILLVRHLILPEILIVKKMATNIGYGEKALTQKLGSNKI